MLNVHEQMDAMGEKSAETGQELNQFAIQAARNIQSEFADFLFDPFEDGLEGMLDVFSDMLSRMAAQAAAKQILTSLFSYGAGAGGGTGDFFTSLLAGVKHTGGIVGSGGASRSVPALAFAGAPRFHDGGIVGNEVPIIAQRGEGVFTPEQMASMGTATVNVQIQTPDPQAFRQSQQQISTQMGRAVERAMRRNT